VKPLFNQGTIVGLGLIGGSLGLALRRQKVARRVIGFSRHERTVRRAKASGAIDDGCTELCPEWLSESDLVVIATPPLSVAKVARRIAKITRDSLVITDVASTKSAIVKELERSLPPRVSFVGAHPMAGSEHSGIEAADPTLFHGAVCLVTPTRRTDAQALSKVYALWRRVGSRVVSLSPQRHDAVVAQISHLPHLAAVGLTLSVSPAALNLAAGGFSDTTRIALSDPALWRQICGMNRRALADALDQYLIRIGQLRDLLTVDDGAGLYRWFRTAQRKRQGLGNRD
jgi:prephenate dehydrogenase